MSILINKDTKLIVQGITGRDGSFHASKMKEYGTNVVGGTSPGKAGQEVCGIPVFNTVKDAVAATGANTSIIFVPAPFAKDAMLEAIDGGIKLVICITEGVPTLDAVLAQRYAKIKGVQLSLVGSKLLFLMMSYKQQLLYHGIRLSLVHHRYQYHSVPYKHLGIRKVLLDELEYCNQEYQQYHCLRPSYRHKKHRRLWLIPLVVYQN